MLAVASSLLDCCGSGGVVFGLLISMPRFLAGEDFAPGLHVHLASEGLARYSSASRER